MTYLSTGEAIAYRSITLAKLKKLVKLVVLIPKILDLLHLIV